MREYVGLRSGCRNKEYANSFIRIVKQRYIRNRIYLTREEQNLIQATPILLGGVGIGSVIAECLVRFGFETITLIDGDVVELSNLNRQNYIELDLATPKVEALKNRLIAINSNAKITAYNCFITPDTIQDFVPGHTIAINALDFTSDVPLLFDSVCQEHDIPVLHPYNLGWSALVMVITRDIGLDSLRVADRPFNELSVVQHVSDYMRLKNSPQEWLDETIRKYKAEEEQLSPPQLSIASWLAAGVCTQIIFDLVTGRSVKKFPEFYLTTIRDADAV